MKRYIVLFIMFALMSSAYSQSDDIYISVAMPNNCQLDNNTKSILKNKLLSVISRVGVAGVECGAIIMVPEVNTVSTNTIYGGMRNITSLELCITITVKNMITGTVFNTMQINISGEGYSDIEAKRSAVNKINMFSPEYLKFIGDAKLKIIDYYKNNTAAIIDKANSLALQQCYDKALALLSTYPESLSGYKEISNAIASIFKKCQAKYCSQILLTAQAAYSRHDYGEAAALVSMIDAQSSCASQAKSLLSSIKKDLDKQYDDAIQLEKEKMKSEERVLLARINAIKDITTSYFQQQTEYIFFW